MKWKLYDEDLPPKTNYEYLVCTKAGFYRIAELEMSDRMKFVWTDINRDSEVNGVLYYAEIDSPFE